MRALTVRQIGSLPRCFAMTLIRIGAARPCRFDRCRFRQPAIIGGTFACTQPCRVLRARLLTGFNPTRDGLVFFHGPLPIPAPGLALCRRAVRDGLHRVLQLSDPALWPLARYERRPDWDACRRAFVAGGVPVDPCRRAYGPVGHSPGCLVLCLDGDGLGAGLPAAAVVLALTTAAGRQL